MIFTSMLILAFVIVDSTLHGRHFLTDILFILIYIYVHFVTPHWISLVIIIDVTFYIKHNTHTVDGMRESHVDRFVYQFFSSLKASRFYHLSRSSRSISLAVMRDTFLAVSRRTRIVLCIIL